MQEILYNVTVKPDSDVHDDWLRWMVEVHIPDVIKTGCFSEALITRMRIPSDPQGESYTIQYRCPDMSTLQRYQAQYAQDLQRQHTERYKDKFLAFRTVTEIVSSYRA